MEMPLTVKAILFDIDGTLVDSNPQQVETWDIVFRREGLTFDRQTIHDQIGKGADMLIPALVPEGDEAQRDRLAAAHGALSKGSYLDGVRPFRGARDLLAAAHAAGQQVVLASSASKDELDHYLDLLDARDPVAATTSADDVERTKPAPDIFAVALTKLASVEPAKAIAVGDTPYDVEPAKRCGVDTIALRSGGFSDAQLRDAGALRLYDDVAALLAGYNGSPLARRS
ncbi:HAD family hydrolase [Sphingomonas adhaesiva]|uniref:HAD family hydrolase n=1 Tax=Sphingomonas adhaesiva TaxID=28212 RepID=UPI002FFB4888